MKRGHPRQRLLKKTCIIIGIMCIQGIALGAPCISLKITGLWAPKTRGFSGGGSAIGAGWAPTPHHTLQVEGLWLDQTAHEHSYQVVQEPEAPLPGDLVFVGSVERQSKSTLRRYGVFGNYIYHTGPLFKDSGLFLYCGIGAGALYNKTQTQTTKTTIETTTAPGLKETTPTISASKHRATFWTPAAQLFIGARWQLTHACAFIIGGRWLFTCSQNEAAKGGPKPIVLLPKAQPLLEAGICFDF